MEERDHDWTGNHDDNPHRDLTEDELLIKAHYDQILARDCPNYMEDAYHRGVWLRTLASFARGGFGDSQDWKRYEKFIVKWTEYYKSLGFKTDDKVEDGNFDKDSDVDSDEESKGNSEDGSEGECGSGTDRKEN